MNWLPEQKLIPQLRLGPRIGAIRELSSQAIFYPNLIRGLLMYGVAYYNTPIINYIPDWLFFASIPILYIGAAVFHYVIVHKALVSFNSTQGADEGVNPQYKRMVDDHEDIHERLDLIQEKLESEE